MKDSNTYSDTWVLQHYMVSQNLFWGVSSTVVSLLSPHTLILTKIYISSQINLFSKLTNCPQPEQSQQGTWFTHLHRRIHTEFSVSHSFRGSSEGEKLSGKHRCEHRSRKVLVNILAKPWRQFFTTRKGRQDKCLLKINLITLVIFLCLRQIASATCCSESLILCLLTRNQTWIKQSTFFRIDSVSRHCQKENAVICS